MAYETTTVTVEKSQGEIRKLLQRFGADNFQFAEGRTASETQAVAVQFVHNNHVVMMSVDLKEPDNAALKGKARRARTKTLDDFYAEHFAQEARRIWRVLYHSLKARMVAVEEGVEEFEQAFLAHLVDPSNGQTLWSRIEPIVTAGHFQVGGSGLTALPRGN